MKALAQFYDLLAPVVLGVLIRVLGASTFAEELLEETFVQAWNQARSSGAGRESPRGWLLGIALSLARDRLSIGAVSCNEEPTGSEEPVEAAPVKPLDAEGALRARLANAMRRLSIEQRLSIELALFGRLTEREIGVALKLPFAVVRTSLAGGMRLLREDCA